MTFLVEYQSIAPFPPLVLAKLIEASAEPYYIAAKMSDSIDDIVIYIFFPFAKIIPLKGTFKVLRANYLPRSICV